MRLITVIAMATSDCNLRCRYCYVRATRRHQSSLPTQWLRTFVRNCSQGFDSVEICWHGGEPLLRGKEFFDAVLEAESYEMDKRPVRFRNMIQTNGTLLDEDWIDYLTNHHITFGISCDAPLDVHAVLRDRDTDRVLRSFALVRDSGLPLNALCVITKLNVRRGPEIFDFFENVGATRYSLLPLRMVHTAHDEKPEESDVFLLYRDTFERWLLKGNNVRSIEPIDTMLRAIVGQKPQLCSFAASCPDRMISVDQDGNVVPCNSLNLPQFIMGNVLDAPLCEILERRRDVVVSARRQAIDEHCKDCEFLPVCQGGCRSDAMWSTGLLNGKDPECGARRQAFVHIRNRLTELGVPLGNRLHCTPSTN